MIEESIQKEANDEAQKLLARIGVELQDHVARLRVEGAQHLDLGTCHNIINHVVAAYNREPHLFKASVRGVRINGLKFEVNLNMEAKVLH